MGYHMELWRIFLIRLGISAAYASVFPVTNVLGGGIAMLGILICIPFLPISLLVGMLFTYWFDSETTYLAGAFLAILIQFLVLWYFLHGARGSN